MSVNQATASHWNEHGYIIARGFIPPRRVRRLLKICEDVWKQWLINDPATGKPGIGGGMPVMRHLNDPLYFKDDPHGLIDLLEFSADPALLQLIADVLGYAALFRSTSFFFNPSDCSRDGNWHRDSQFLTATDEEEKRMILSDQLKGMQLQIVLVASEDSEYVPGSHRRWDTPEEYAIRKADGCRNALSNSMPGAVRVSLQPGDLVAFHSAGLHRGRYHTDKIRRTLMLTYTDHHHVLHDHFVTDQVWFLNDSYLEGLSPHAKQFYRQFKAIFEEDWKKELSATA